MNPVKQLEKIIGINEDKIILVSRQILVDIINELKVSSPQPIKGLSKSPFVNKRIK